MTRPRADGLGRAIGHLVHGAKVVRDRDVNAGNNHGLEWGKMRATRNVNQLGCWVIACTGREMELFGGQVADTAVGRLPC